MALQKDHALQNGLFAENAYHRIDSVYGHKLTINISVNVYATKRQFTDGKPYLEQKTYEFEPKVTPDAKELWTQAYEYLKTLDDYAEALDC